MHQLGLHKTPLRHHIPFVSRARPHQRVSRYSGHHYRRFGGTDWGSLGRPVQSIFRITRRAQRSRTFRVMNRGRMGAWRLVRAANNRVNRKSDFRFGRHCHYWCRCQRHHVCLHQTVAKVIELRQHLKSSQKRGHHNPTVKSLNTVTAQTNRC